MRRWFSPQGVCLQECTLSAACLAMFTNTLTLSQIDDRWFLTSAHDYCFNRLVFSGVQFLMRNIRVARRRSLPAPLHRRTPDDLPSESPDMP
jgi:hypothetical protein